MLGEKITRYGAPYHILTDNGLQFTDKTFNNFLCSYDIEHKTSPPLWTHANDEVERQNRSLLQAIRIAHSEGRDWKTEITTFLQAYRTTPHSITGIPPDGAFLQRTVRCNLATHLPEQLFNDEMKDRDSQKKEKGKQQGNAKAAPATTYKQTLNYLLPQTI